MTNALEAMVENLEQAWNTACMARASKRLHNNGQP
jgi:hypothetical protein